MSQEPAPNFHTNEEAVILDVNSVTKTVFDAIETELGSLSQSSFSKLNDALDDIITSLTKIKNDINDKKKALTSNRELVDYSVIKIPDPGVPDISAASKTVNQVIGNHTSVDIQALHMSIATAQKVRVPREVTAFEKNKIALVGAKLDVMLSDISSAQDNVNAIKKIVESKT